MEHLTQCIRPPLGPGELRLASEVYAVALVQAGLSGSDPLSLEVAGEAIVLLQAGIRDVEILVDTLLWLSIIKRKDRETHAEHETVAQADICLRTKVK